MGEWNGHGSDPYKYIYIYRYICACTDAYISFSSHLSNNGVEETPPSRELHNGNGDAPSKQDDLFINLEGANVGFQHWHPVAVTAQGDRLAGQGELGGVWEWTSSTLVKHEGFEPMASYPGYTGKEFVHGHL